MNVLETIPHDKRVNDVIEAMKRMSDRGRTIIHYEASKVLAAYPAQCAVVIQFPKRRDDDRLAGAAADTMAKIPRESEPAAPSRRATKKTKGIASPP